LEEKKVAEVSSAVSEKSSTIEQPAVDEDLSIVTPPILGNVKAEAVKVKKICKA
jgi:hypothetical protein